MTAAASGGTATGRDARPLSRRPVVTRRRHGEAVSRAARAPVDLDTLRDLRIRLCRAVLALHHQNVIHLDLNPNNVRSRADGAVQRPHDQLVSSPHVRVALDLAHCSEPHQF